MTIRILWVSRHPILPGQEKELKRLFGDDIEIIHYKSIIKDADHLLTIKATVNADEVIAVLPQTIIEKLIEKGLKPIRAHMEAIHICSTKPCPDYNPDTDWIDPGSSRHYRFMYFERILEIKVVTQRLYPPLKEE